MSRRSDVDLSLDKENLNDYNFNNREPLRNHPMFRDDQDGSSVNQFPIGCSSATDRRRISDHPFFKDRNIPTKRSPNKKCNDVGGGVKRLPISQHPFFADKFSTVPTRSAGKENHFNANYSSFCSPKKKIDTCFTGAPLSPIDNNIIKNKKERKRRNLFPQDGLIRDLYAETENNGSTTADDTDYDQIEESIISGFNDSSHDSISDDEISVTVDPTLQEYESDDGLTGGQTRPVPAEYASLGGPSVKCQFCNAYMWKEERVNKRTTKGRPLFSICCRKGLISLPKAPPTPSYLWKLYTDPTTGSEFQRCSRIYNSMFAFTSIGGSVDHSVNNGGGPYVYRLNGQNHHVFGSLIPHDGETPKFCQLYIFDTENEVSNRMQWIDMKDGDKVHEEIVSGLINMFDKTNELVKEFRGARDRFKDSPFVDLKIVLKVCRSQSGRENNIGPSNEVAAIMVGDSEDPCENRDIIVDSKKRGLERITNIHPKLMSLQYPLLFPCGEDGFHNGIKYVTRDVEDSRKRQKCSMMDFYSYKFQVRGNEGNTPRLGGRLFQQYIVDSFSAIEQSRLWWFRTHQTTLRSDLYSNICDYIRKGDGDASTIGKSFILPAGFVGSKRYMQQNFQDALAVCRHVGHPDLFLTMTSNPLWDEITQMLRLIPNATPVDNPDIVARVFRLKLDQLLDDIQKNSFFGTCIGVMYVVEFQKRGLPHVHMLIWLDGDSKKELMSNVDKFVSAEIPDPQTDKAGYDAVSLFMMHGPCGAEFPKSPCMKDFKCTRHYPKKYCKSTNYDESGFPIYMRRQNGSTVKVRKAELDNQWVVPYNRDLLVKYQCHINVEVCCHARSLKYLFKYCLKGHDRATVEVRGRRTTKDSKSDEGVDEIQAYFDGRYLCGSEASYRTFGFPIHYRSISVMRLSFHLPGQKNVTFKTTDSLKKIKKLATVKPSKLEAFFSLNCTDSAARKYTYDEIPRYYVWNDAANMWTPRKKGFQIGRLVYTHHSAGEVWYLRLLLSKVRGPVSFTSLRTIKGVEYASFQEACNQYGLLDNDDEWHEVLAESSKCGFAPQIRQLFVHVIVNCQVSDLLKLWNSHFQALSEDILFKLRRCLNKPDLSLSIEEIKFHTLAEIDLLLKALGRGLKDFTQLPQPPASYLHSCDNHLLMEELNYDKQKMEEDHTDLLSHLNKEQLQIYHSVLDSVDNDYGIPFFVYGSGGCGKTYLWRTLICKLRATGRIVLPVASSGIAATLLPGGRTAHSRFKIPILLDDFSLCSISHNSDYADLIKRTSLIIWDEAPMQHRYAFECLDRTLKEIMKAVDPKRFHLPFGGITVLLGGDFRQILPVIKYGSRGDIVSACITRSHLWRYLRVFILLVNMRLKNSENRQKLSDLTFFAKWVLDIGDGNIPNVSGNVDTASNEFQISIPPPFCNAEISNSVNNMVESTYPNLLSQYKSPSYLSERAILTPTNKTVSHINSAIVDLIPGEGISYFSVDKAEDFGGTEDEFNLAFPVEFLNSLCVSGLAHHELKFKVGVVVMLIRNLNQTIGLCNGTRMVIIKCLKHCVECEVISGTFSGSRHFIPRMECSPTDTTLPFKLIRKQMPLQVCYAMTINKSQGQSLKRAGVFLPGPVFTHGQFYVAVSRVTSPDGLKIFIDDEISSSCNITKNVVYKEVFYNLPR